MNKFIVTSLFAVAFSLAAHAVPSWAALYMSAADADKNPSTAKSANYSAYYCTKAAAMKMFGFEADAEVTLKDLSNYLKQNFTTASQVVRAQATAFTSAEYGLGQYAFVNYVKDAFEEGDYIAVAMYKSDAFMMYSSSDVDSGNLTFNDKGSGTGSSGSWQAVPEPTSGLLLLLGLAGLALKRKQA